MKCLLHYNFTNAAISLILGSLAISANADNLPKANVNLIFTNSLNPSYVESTTASSSSESQSLSGSELSAYSSVLQLEYYDRNLAIKVGQSITEPMNDVNGELDTSDPNLYAMMLQLPTLMVEYKHIAGDNGDYYSNLQCVLSPRIMNIISFNQQNDETWEPSSSLNINKQSMNIQSNNNPEQSCSNFDFQYSMSVSSVESSQNQFNVDITFYITLNRNGVNALAETNNEITQANNPNNNVW